VQLSVTIIWERLTPEFYDVLQSIHGKEGDGKPRGHRLFARFPILALDPDPDFVARCIDHFVRILHLHEIEDDIRRAELEAAEGGESAVALLISRVRESHSEQEHIAAEALALTEEADDIRRPWASGRGTMLLAA